MYFLGILLAQRHYFSLRASLPPTAAERRSQNPERSGADWSGCAEAAAVDGRMIGPGIGQRILITFLILRSGVGLYVNMDPRVKQTFLHSNDG